MAHGYCSCSNEDETAIFQYSNNILRMKQKVLFSLMLLCMSLCSISSWAEIVRPTMPEATLESGKSYYLYNVEVDLFAKKEAGCLYVNEDPSILEITVADNGTVTMKNENDYMVCNYDGVRWGASEF